MYRDPQNTRSLQADRDRWDVYSIIGRVRRALIADGQEVRAREFVERASRSGSYDAVLALCLEYVDVR